MINIKTGQLLASLSATLLLAACASEPTATERAFGDSVRQMISAQTYDPSTLTNPPEGAIENTDGQMLQGALESYRETVADQGAVGDSITINVGQ
jgi:type IV pilus biogenesis protein CpaD/CtpE